jgi:hypothetical protein
LVVLVAVARHGKLVPVEVVRHVFATRAATVVQPLNVPVVIVRTSPLSTRVVNRELVHDETRPPADGDVNPMFDESSVLWLLAGLQLAAEDTAGNTNAHTAIAPAKSKTPFLENFFISNTPCQSRHNAETNGPTPNRAGYT